MGEALKIFESILRRNGKHITRARLGVFKTLYDTTPKSMNELHRILKHDIDRTSIYRSVELFEKLGIIHRIQIGWKYKVELSDIFVEHHHHISCLQCGRVIAVKEDERLEILIREIARANNISRPVHQIEIQGYCERCI